jgi:hypothetical protein
MTDIRTIYLDVVGVQFRTSKESREILRRLVERGGVTVTLDREPDNPHDEYAIRVLIERAKGDRGRFGNRRIGYIRATTAAKLAPRLDSGDIRFVSATATDLDENLTMRIEAKFEKL